MYKGKKKKGQGILAPALTHSPYYYGLLRQIGDNLAALERISTPATTAPVFA